MREEDPIEVVISLLWNALIECSCALMLLLNALIALIVYLQRKL